DPSHIGLRPVAALVGAAERARLTVTRVEYLPSHVPGLRRLERVLGRWLPLLRRRIGIVARKAEQR
ncbi:MAG: hypothetical protein HY561_13620, partial [Gemmatimonadetes bacterium]|nr:hypothetical protein [Gemmatimonadota bacterium]